jgi:hypothetical protein
VGLEVIDLPVNEPDRATYFGEIDRGRPVRRPSSTHQGAGDLLVVSAPAQGPCPAKRRPEVRSIGRSVSPDSAGSSPGHELYVSVADT